MARHAPLRSSRKEPDAVVDGAHPERPMPKFRWARPSWPSTTCKRIDVHKPSEAFEIVVG